MGDGGKILNPDVDGSCSAQKATDVNSVLTWGPVVNLRDFAVVWDAPFIVTHLSDDNDFRSTCEELFGGYSCTSMFQPMKNTIDIVAMFPNKTSDARIFRYGLI